MTWIPITLCGLVLCLAVVLYFRGDGLLNGEGMEPSEDIERRAYPRITTCAHVMIKVGFDGSAYGFGTVCQISRKGFLLETDLIRDMGLGVMHRHVGREILLHGSEAWNRRFFIMGRIVRITKDERVACSICSVSSDEFLRAWIQREQR